ncbi:MAG: hypothetical protein QXZ41_04675 [Ignisphaera sp.]
MVNFNGCWKIRLTLYIVDDEILKGIACEAVLGMDTIQLLELYNIVVKVK